MPRASPHGTPSIGNKKKRHNREHLSFFSKPHPSLLTQNPCPKLSIQPGIRKSYQNKATLPRELFFGVRCTCILRLWWTCFVRRKSGAETGTLSDLTFSPATFYNPLFYCQHSAELLRSCFLHFDFSTKISPISRSTHTHTHTHNVFQHTCPDGESALPPPRPSCAHHLAQHRRQGRHQGN